MPKLPEPPRTKLWIVELGPFYSYEQALETATPIHADDDRDYSVAIVEYDAKGKPVKVTM